MLLHRQQRQEASSGMGDLDGLTVDRQLEGVEDPQPNGWWCRRPASLSPIGGSYG
jgi:hypothetical protein